MPDSEFWTCITLMKKIFSCPIAIVFYLGVPLKESSDILEQIDTAKIWSLPS